MDDILKNYDNNIHHKFTIKQNLDKAIHTLEGILKGISISGTISETESKMLKEWITKNSELMSNPPLNELIYILEGVCEYNKLGNDDKENIIYICQNFHEDSIFYNDNTSDIQTLHGILHGILADNHISIEELTHLQIWLNEHDNLEGIYPYDEINSLIYSIIKNNYITNEEENLLKAYFSQFVDLNINIDKNLLKTLNTQGICMLNPKIHLKNSLFCFTGKSSRCQRKEIAKLIEKNGGLFNDRIVNDTNYLIVGNEGNPDWAYACYGRKIERAIKLRKEGNPIKIINELDFWNIIDNNLEPYNLSHNTSITNSIKDNTISLAANDINPYSLETAIDKLEHLPEDIQITFKEFLYEFLFHKHTNYALPAKEAQLLIDAGFLEEIDDIQALLQTYTRNEINKMLTSNEINGFKKNLKLEILINWCIENIPNEKIKEIFSPNYIVCTLFIKYKSIVRKIYRYLIRKYDTEDLFDGEKIIPVPKGAKYSMETCRFEFPDDDVTQLLNKYNANLLNKNNL